MSQVPMSDHPASDEVLVREDWSPHAGLHHFAPCGEYRPVTSHPCPACEDRCPGCGTWWSARREETP